MADPAPKQRHPQPGHINVVQQSDAHERQAARMTDADVVSRPKGCPVNDLRCGRRSADRGPSLSSGEAQAYTGNAQRRVRGTGPFAVTNRRMTQPHKEGKTSSARPVRVRCKGCAPLDFAARAYGLRRGCIRFAGLRRR